MATVANLQVQIGATIKGLEGSLKKAESSLNKFAKNAQSIGATMSTYFTTPIVGGLGLAVKAASDAEETFSKFATVFRDVQEQAENAFSTLRNEYGLSATASKQLLGDTGDLLTGFGFAQSEALRLSTEVQKLAVDLASFTNFSGGAEGASQALTKALLGERESVKALGIAILEEDVQKQMAINTAKGLTFATERQAKAQATLDLAIQQSQNAIGDYARTSDSFANQMRLLQTRVSDLAVELGTTLLPMARDLLDNVQSLVQRFQNLDADTKQSILTFGLLFAAIGPVVVVLGQAALAMSVFSKALAFTIANPFTLVYAGAVALLGIITKLGLEYRKTKSLIEDTSLGSDMPLNDQIGVSITRLRELQTQLSKLQEKQENTASGNVVGTYDIQIMQLRKRIEEERKLIVQLVERSNTEKKVADDSVDAINKVANIASVAKPTIPVAFTVEPMADVVKRVEESLQPLEDLLEFDYSVPDKLFPPGSIGFLQTKISTLTELMRGMTNPEDIEAYRLEIEQLQNQLSNLQNGVTTTSGAFDFMSGIANQFADSFGAGLANIIVQGEKLQDVLKNIGKLLLSAAIQKGISLLLTGGLPGTGFFGSVADGGGGGIFGKLFKTRSNDALITSTGRVIEFSPKDNILAMQDFGQMRPASTGIAEIRVSVDDIRLSGSDILIALRNAERAYR